MKAFKLMLAVLMAAGAGYSALITVNFESDTVGNQPSSGSPAVRPLTNTATNYVEVVDSVANKAGTGKGVELVDNNIGAGSALEYNFVSNTA